MAIRPDYDIGTVTLTSGSSDFTTTGSALQTAAVQAGDAIITPSGHVLIIASITGQNSGTLFLPCPPAAAGTGLALRIRFQPDGSRYQGAVRNLVDLLSSGNIEALAALVGSAGLVPIFTGVGTMDLADPATFGLPDENGNLAEFSSLTLGESKLLGTGSDGALVQIDRTILTQSDFFRGFAYSPNASAPTTRLDVAAGMCRDATNAFTINLSNPVTKNVTAAFAAGNGNGALDTGTISSGFFSIHAISNPTTGAADILVSLSMNNPVMPAGFTARRWIGGYCYAGGIIDFVATGDWHYYKTRIASVAAAPNGTTPQYRLLAVPLGAKCQVQAYLQSYDNTATNPGWLIVRDPDAGSFTVSSSVADWFYETGKFIITRSFIRTDNVGRVITADTNANGYLTIGVEGWSIDRSVYR